MEIRCEFSEFQAKLSFACTVLNFSCIAHYQLQYEQKDSTTLNVPVVLAQYRLSQQIVCYSTSIRRYDNGHVLSKLSNWQVRNHLAGARSISTNINT